MGGPSEHLSWKELACKDGTPYPIGYIQDGTALALANVFEIIRKELGNKPLTILSAYRTPAHNRKIGGARHSQHVLGRALDIACPTDRTFGDFALKMDKIAKTTMDIRGIGFYRKHRFIHIDIRSSPKMVVWNGDGAKDANT